MEAVGRHCLLSCPSICTEKTCIGGGWLSHSLTHWNFVPKGEYALHRVGEERISERSCCHWNNRTVSIVFGKFLACIPGLSCS